MPATPKTTKTDPRADFAALDDAQLAAELERLDAERVRLNARIEAQRPTREDVAAKVDGAHAVGIERLTATRAAAGLDALRNAVPGTQGYRALEELVIGYVISSDGFAEAMLNVLSKDRPSEADVEPHQEELTAVHRRRRAVELERGLRALDAEQTARRAKLESTLGALDAA